MAERRVTMESGGFDWNATRGYEAPRPRPGGSSPDPGFGYDGFDPPKSSPDWPQPNETITFEREITPQPQQQANPAEFVHVSRLEQLIGDAVLRVLEEQRSAGTLNLNAGTAEFMGHAIELGPIALKAIQQIIASEVCESLAREQQRVLDAVQVRPTNDPSMAVVLDVPSAEAPMGTVEPSPSEPVL